MCSSDLVPPRDRMMDLRNEMMQVMIQSGIDVEAQRHCHCDDMSAPYRDAGDRKE